MNYSLTRATLWNLAGYLYLLLASFVSTPLLLHALGLRLFARYALILAALALSSSLDLGLPAAVVRALAQTESPSSRRQIWTTSRTLFLATGLLVTILTFFFTFPFRYPWGFYGLVGINFLLAHALTLPHSLGRFGWFNLKTFLVGTANTLLAAFLAQRGWGISALLSAQLFFALLTLFLLILFNRSHLRYSRFSPPRARALLSFGLKNQLGKLISQIEAQYPKFLLVLLSPFAVSAYTVAQNLVTKLAGSINQLATALYPRSSRDSQLSTLRFLYLRLELGLFVLSVAGIATFQIFGFSFLSWWLKSPELVTAVFSILKILVWALALLVLTPLPATILDSLGKPGLTSLFSTITFFIEVAFAVLFLPRFGLFAPAYAALFSLIIMVPILLVTTHRTLIHSAS